MFRRAFSRKWLPGRSAFTLLEVMLAVFILGLVVLSIYRFLEANLRAIQFSAQQADSERAIKAVTDVLQAQINALPSDRPNPLKGDAYTFKEMPQDEIEWLCSAGNGLFTEHATGDYRVTLTLRPNDKTGDLELGLRRVKEDGNPDEFHWLPLMRGVRGIEVRYFDPRLNNWLERWVDAGRLPSLIRIRVWRGADEDPYEVALHLPPRQGGAEAAPALAAPGTPAAPAPPRSPPAPRYPSANVAPPR
jgi:prepilin-type N-terminal cleavage/methylation domain-containing protein